MEDVEGSRGEQGEVRHEGPKCGWRLRRSHREPAAGDGRVRDWLVHLLVVTEGTKRDWLPG